MQYNYSDLFYQKRPTAANNLHYISGYDPIELDNQRTIGIVEIYGSETLFVKLESLQMSR